jgi:hypothetical protein
MIRYVICSSCQRSLPEFYFSDSELPVSLGGSYKSRRGRRCIPCVNSRERRREQDPLGNRCRKGRAAARRLVKIALGGLPDHWFVVFKDGNNLNVTLNNLIVVTGPNREIVRKIVGRRQYGLYGKIDMALFAEQREVVLV